MMSPPRTRFPIFTCTLALILGTLAVASSVRAQSFNIDFGDPLDVIPNTYAAAGHAGTWQSLIAAHGTSTFNLIDVNGNPTAAWLRQIGGTQLVSVHDPSMTGNDAKLMNDFLVTYSPSLESCLFFNDVENGLYRITMYARMPMQPTVLSYTSCDQESGFPHYSVGGRWSGQHQPMVSYSEHIVNCTNGRLYLHSGIVPGANPALGAAVNGIQLHKIQIVPGDTNLDEDVNVDDLLNVINSWGQCPAPCAADMAPPGGNGFVNVDDLLVVINNWG